MWGPGLATVMLGPCIPWNHRETAETAWVGTDGEQLRRLRAHSRAPACLKSQSDGPNGSSGIIDAGFSLRYTLPLS